ncbi:MAG: isochorismate synthase [Actinomycetes bacterium]
MSGLAATAYRLESKHEIDYIALGVEGRLFGHDNQVVAGLGAALEIHLPEGLEDTAAFSAAGHSLEAIHLRSSDAPAPRALGSFGFLPSSPGNFVVPEISYLEREGEAWLVHVGAGEDQPSLDALLKTVAQASGPRQRERASAMLAIDLHEGVADYEKAVNRALELIDGRSDRKIVLARQLIVRVGINALELLKRLHELEPSCTLYAIPNGQEQFVGASPELLLRRMGRQVETFPLAGTVALSEGPAAVHQLSLSEKDRREHGLVVQDLIERLRPYCTELIVPAAPSLVMLRSVAHLGTQIFGKIQRARGGPVGVLSLLAAIHPTPAVGGLPRDWALDAITKIETFDRGLWAGAVGWFDQAGDGEFVLGIRGAFCGTDQTRIVAGAGIVQGSEASAEAMETSHKIRSISDALSER